MVIGFHLHFSFYLYLEVYHADPDRSVVHLTKNFKFRNNFRFAEELQSWCSEFLHTCLVVSLLLAPHVAAVHRSAELASAL